jgi:hypothetical protein
VNVEIPGKGVVEFPDSMSQDDIAQAIQQITAPERPPGEGTPKPSFLQALGGAAKERLGEIGQLPGDMVQSVKNVGSALSDRNLPLRLAPMTVPGLGPMATSAANLGTEGLAQYQEGQFKPGQLAMAALPAFLAGGARAVRAGDRMLTRAIPSKFAAAQQEALGSAKDLTQSLTPDTRALYQQAGQAMPTSAPLDLAETGKTFGQLQAQHAAAPALSSASEAERQLVSKLGALQQPNIPLTDADALMRELTKVITGREAAKGTAKLLQGSMVKDLERAGASGNQGADLMRQAAEGYKSGMGASRLEDMVTKASPPLTGAEPALNVRALGKSVRNDKELPRLLGPNGMEQVQAFLEKYRGLPPDRMSTLATIAKGALGSGPGGYIGNAVGGPAGAALGGVIGALGPEYLQNLAYVGSNPAGLNKGLTLTAQSLRALLGQ